jgi:hypothetical protein
MMLGLSSHTNKLPFPNYPKLEINGSNTVSMNISDISGSTDLYSDSNYGTSDQFSNTSSLSITGELLRNLKMQASVSADRFNPGDVRWNLLYDGNDIDVRLGEFSAPLSGNAFVAFTRALTGLQVDTKLPINDGTLTVVTSALKSQVQTETFFGENITGPLFYPYHPSPSLSRVKSYSSTANARSAGAPRIIRSIIAMPCSPSRASLPRWIQSPSAMKLN